MNSRQGLRNRRSGVRISPGALEKPSKARPRTSPYGPTPPARPLRALIQPGDGQFHHSHGALDDTGARCDDGVGLLPAQHGLGDLRGVG